MAIVLASAAPLLAQPPSGPTITRILWGFDGTVMQGRFCPLTLIFDNPTAKPFSGEVRAYRSQFGGSRSGAVLSREIFLAPGTRRIVQFYPYIISGRERWVIEWAGKQNELNPVKTGKAARVALIGEARVYRAGGAVKRFPERLFPPLSTATDCLGVVILDHVPDWDGPRRQAFLDWLRQGGTLHLLQSVQGSPPRFGEDLNALNQPSQQFHVGGGQVIRHPVSLSQLTPQYVRENLDPEPAAEDPAENLIEQYSGQSAQARGGSPYSSVAYQIPLRQWSFHDRIFRDLKQIVIPDHNWVAIHLLSLAYVVVLFPGCFLVGREYRKTPLTLGLIVGSTLLFGAAFYQVGNRGYRESTNVHSVALARHIDGDKFDLMSWSNLFVTGGGYYRLTNPGADRLYSAATNTEAVGGVITSGSRGRFVVDIPPFSSRVMARKAIATIPAAGPVRPVASPNGGQDLAFSIPPDIANHLQSAYVLIDDEAARARLHEGTLVLGGRQPTAEWVRPATERMRRFGFYRNQQEKTDLGKNGTAQKLILYSLGVVKDKQLEDFRVPEGFARVYLYARRPANLALHASDATEPVNSVEPEPIRDQSGYILYDYLVPLSGGPSGE